MPVIRVSDYVMDILKKYAIPLEDNPDSVLRKILEEYNDLKHKIENVPTSADKTISTRREKTFTSDMISRASFPRDYVERYARWIIASLFPLGGSADAKTVISQIQKTFKDEFTKKELGVLPSGEFRWIKNVNWARYDMVRGGLLNENAPYGIWELTEKGKTYYDNPNEKDQIIKGEITMEDLTPRQFGRLFREAIRQDLKNKFDNLYLMKSWLITIDNKVKILSPYSNKDKDDDKWFYGITEKDWTKWDNNSYLILLMRDGPHCSYVLLNQAESKELLSRLAPARDGSKKINVRMPSTGKIYIEKWPDFPFAERIVELKVKEPPSNLTVS